MVAICFTNRGTELLTTEMASAELVRHKDLTRHTGQKIALGFAIACLLAAVPTAGVFVWALVTKELSDTWVPSLFASISFFISCAAVCYVMSRPQPPLPAQPMADEGGERTECVTAPASQPPGSTA